MLSQNERYSVLLYLHYCCQFVPLPARVDLREWSLDLKLSPWMKGVTLVSRALYLLNVAFKVGSLMYVLAFEANAHPLHQVILQGMVTWAGIIAGAWYWIVYRQNLHVHANLTQMILKHPHNPQRKYYLACIVKMSIPYRCI